MWHLKDHHAQFSWDRFGGQIDLANPHSGLTDLWISPDRSHPQVRQPSSERASSEGARYRVPRTFLWRLRFPYETAGSPIFLADHYARGNDLVATYGPTSIGQFQPQVYWRLGLQPPWLGLELVVSLQTSLLDSRPAFSTESQFPNGPLWLVSETASGQLTRIEPQDAPVERDLTDPCRAVACYFEEADVTLVEMVHPSDFYRLRIQPTAAGPQVHWDLFPEQLEKGVIRRGRLRFGWLAGRPTPPRLGELVLEFAQSPPPLTA